MIQTVIDAAVLSFFVRYPACGFSQSTSIVSFTIFGSSGFCVGSERFEHPQLDFQGMAPASADVVVAITGVYDSFAR